MRYIKRYIPILTTVKFKNLPFFFFFVGTSSFYFLEITATQIQDMSVYAEMHEWSDGVAFLLITQKLQNRISWFLVQLL